MAAPLLPLRLRHLPQVPHPGTLQDMHLALPTSAPMLWRSKASIVTLFNRHRKPMPGAVADAGTSNGHGRSSMHYEARNHDGGGARRRHLVRELHIQQASEQAATRNIDDEDETSPSAVTTTTRIVVGRLAAVAASSGHSCLHPIS
uniref:Uncharacterized protein n=1 Tax=Oryza glumipatula TaxID=40148 RepID=A0A0D9YPU3_9ORYZ